VVARAATDANDEPTPAPISRQWALLRRVRRSVGATVKVALTLTPVPEPAVPLLLVAGAGVLAMKARRRQG
jgi:hypothetical protein